MNRRVYIDSPFKLVELDPVVNFYFFVFFPSMSINNHLSDVFHCNNRLTY